MPTECDLLKVIKTYAKALARDVAPAEYCHGKTLEAIEQECQKRLAEIEAEYKRSTATAAQAYDGSPLEEKADLARSSRATGWPSLAGTRRSGRTSRRAATRACRTSRESAG